MVNPKTKERELAYTVIIDGIEPIVGSDNCEAAVVGGWKIMVRKGTFSAGDVAVYFEIDSKLPEKPEFEFLAAKHYKVKTQKYTFGGKNPGFYSQGLLMSVDELGVEAEAGIPLTKDLGVTYAIEEDNFRKANSVNKYQKMAQRMGKKFSKNLYRWLMKRRWGQRLLYLFYGKKKLDSLRWPEWVVKTDETRCQNIPKEVYDSYRDEKWILTEKVDGTSATFTMKRESFGRYKYFVCSRNVPFYGKKTQCYYDTNVYLEISNRYGIEDILKSLMNKYPNAKYVTIQGEIYGAGIQKRDYKMGGIDLACFNLIIDGIGRLDSIAAKHELEKYDLKWVPILDENYELPESVDKLLEFATGSSTIDGGMREGVVLRDQFGNKSFKAVSNEYLIKYHN